VIGKPSQTLFEPLLLLFRLLVQESLLKILQRYQGSPELSALAEKHGLTGGFQIVQDLSQAYTCTHTG